MCTSSERTFRVNIAKSCFVLAGIRSTIRNAWREDITFVDPWKSVVSRIGRFALFSQIKPNPLNRDQTQNPITTKNMLINPLSLKVKIDTPSPKSLRLLARRPTA
jgi:hypothetical protein